MNRSHMNRSHMNRFDFRVLSDNDLPTMYRWLNEPGILRWWEGDDVSWPSVVKDYAPLIRQGQAKIDGVPADRAEHWIADLDGEPFGWLDCYPVANEPSEAEPWSALGVPLDTAGIDYLVGDPERRGLGLGTEMIRQFIERIVFGRHPEWSWAAAAPHLDNISSWRMLAKAGFMSIGNVNETIEMDGQPVQITSRLMAIQRSGR